jgi:hypothetical protein
MPFTLFFHRSRPSPFQTARSDFPLAVGYPCSSSTAPSLPQAKHYSTQPNAAVPPFNHPSGFRTSFAACFRVAQTRRQKICGISRRGGGRGEIRKGDGGMGHEPATPSQGIAFASFLGKKARLDPVSSYLVSCGRSLDL